MEHRMLEGMPMNFLKVVHGITSRDFTLSHFCYAETAKEAERFFKRKERLYDFFENKGILGKLYLKKHPIDELFRSSDFYSILYNIITFYQKEYGDNLNYIEIEDAEIFCSDQFIRVFCNKFYADEIDSRDERMKPRKADDDILRIKDKAMLREKLTYEMAIDFNKRKIYPIAFKGFKYDGYKCWNKDSEEELII